MEYLKTKKIYKITVILCLLILTYYAYQITFRIDKIKLNKFIQNFTAKFYLDIYNDNQNLLKTNVLSYSLFGNNWERYGENVEHVANEAANNSLYKEWTIRVYHDKYSISLENVMNLTKRYQNLEFFNVSNFADLEGINGMVWRFLVVADSTVDIACIRDLDSKILERESDAVRVWLKSGKLVYAMKDHPQHDIPILGGMWCYRNELNRELGIKVAKLCIENSMHRNPINQAEAKKGDDQSIITRHILPLINENLFIHDSYLCHSNKISESFPTQRDVSGEFIGQVRGTPGIFQKCPIACRPKEHQDWEYC
ncbi:uncharacterized protein LOC136082004 [Hydra vulgaris]|uniref:Uncharacterized protein LOC136082004 n=1 Tax=Hydra vulgaris TaxID=6087 RepID=A0ABM4C4W4_HYDVU